MIEAGNIEGIRISEESPNLDRRIEISACVEKRHYKRLKAMDIEIVPEKEIPDESCFETTFPPSIYSPADTSKSYVD